MRSVAFYAPLKPPDHPTPSGDRRMARALLQALRLGGHEVEVASRLRTYDRAGDRHRQARLAAIGGRCADRLIRRYRAQPLDRRPRAWLTYHAYHKSPDWLGESVSTALAIPYVHAETSFAPKQQRGPWAFGHEATARAIRAADVVLALTAVDVGCLAPLVRPPAELRQLTPFLDPAPFRAAAGSRATHRRRLAERLDLDPDKPWLLTVAMMRDDVKRRSFELLAEALATLGDLDWQLLVVGDGPARTDIEARLRAAAGERVCFAGALEEAELPAVYAAADLFVWPAVREAYGLAMLEAQAAGVPVVAGDEGGVAEVVSPAGGVLTPARDQVAFARAVRAVLAQPERRRAMAAAVAAFVAAERSIERAAADLSAALSTAESIRARRCRRS